MANTIKSIISIMRHQVPLFTLIPQIYLTKHVFESCTENNESQEDEIIVSSSILLLVTLIWSIWHANLNFQKAYHKKTNKILYIFLHAFSSMLAYVALSYHLYDGGPYYCINNIEYNSDLSWVLLACSGSVICLISVFEHTYWPKAEALGESIRPDSEVLLVRPYSGSNPLRS